MQEFDKEHNVFKGFCYMMDIDWDDVVASYKAYVENPENEIISFDEWLASLPSDEEETGDDIPE